ncbi:hypothetical protein AB0K00_35300 [Dactylosporangium sp. NPDC049525]|uniref:hypothetical protein n=1 Tax=Dactylosporangium sp. NPDC049525 TaxID=3154730 RepID=UPI003448E122
MKRPFVLSLAALIVPAVLPFVSPGPAAAAPVGSARIAFSRNDDLPGTEHEIMSMTSTGTNVVVLTNTPAVVDLDPVYSPDGKRIAFTRWGAGPDELWVMNADGTGLAVVPGSGRAHHPAWSPDGKRLAYARMEPVPPYTAHICIRDLKGGSYQLLSATPGANDWAPAWSPDGTRIAWNRWIGGASQLLVLTLKGLSLDQLTPLTPGRDDAWPDWSPDSKQIVFSRFESGAGIGSSLYRMSAKGGPVTLVLAGIPLVNDTYFTMPDWSPDGTKIAYAGMDDDEGWGNIYTITPDGKNNTQLTFGTATDMSPDWTVA